ncbi:hypothetical protein GRI62_11500 [Erythrobacter arachoides]|uniref:HEAT repeat domain-containing protein n=1 Tax=Aurantiacibacter arachoides TaxID=1850444 RepID=A0A845A3K7_9SPHN|nr:HEAT repeat domain-containing protein [Aurantiacibacter arachoides]MXO94220.1 hypothetical protein [Aurantiacibacter arachoides]GGD65173.1 hypothetical protein GCM10011411_26870 [Aurantiacibacter arachoides]
MTTLTNLWLVSLALCMITAIALLVLIGARSVTARFGTREEAARRALLPRMLDGDPALLTQLQGLDLRVACNLTVELAEMTRGSEREALLARATALGVPGLLMRRLRARSAQTRLSAAEAIAMFDQCHDEAHSALDDRNADVRLGAALALAQRGEAPDPLTVVRKLKVGQEEHSLLLVSLMKDLATTNSEAVAGLLFEQGLSSETKVAAMDALADLGGEYAPLLAYMARSAEDEPELQPRIYRALGRTGHPAGAEAILHGLQSDDWTVRSSAAESAGKSRLAQAAGRLGEMLADPHYWVRYRASEALLRLGPRGINTLRDVSRGEDEGARDVATKMLSEGRAA